MSKQTNSAESEKPKGERLQQARISTRTAKDMIHLLKDRPFEVVARGPHQLKDDLYVVEVIAPKSELEKLPEGDWKIETREPCEVKDPKKQLSTGNRYAKETAIPRGVGIKKRGED